MYNNSRSSVNRLITPSSPATVFVLQLMAVLVLTVSYASAFGQASNQSAPIVLRNPSQSQILTQPRMTVGYSAGSIQAAVDVPGPDYVYLPCGTYTGNIVISHSDVRIVGEERGCVQLIPADPTLPAVSIDATNAGDQGMGFDEVSNLTITCPPGTECADGLLITGRSDINQPNDWHKFSRLGIYGQFENGIDITGRTIWSEFDNIEVALARGNGINIATGDTVNELTFFDVRSAYNYNYGVYINSTQKDLINGIFFEKVNVEYNGNNPSLADCAGIYMTGVSQMNITSSYFEGNCASYPATNRGSEIRLTGTYNQSVSITDSVFNLQYTENGIYNDSTQTTGTYDGDKFTGSGQNGMTIYVATTHPLSNITIGDNFSSTPTVTIDANGNSHVHSISPLAFDYTAVTSVPNNTISVAGENTAILYNGPYTIDYLSNGQLGQIVDIFALNKGPHTLVNAAGGAGQIIFPDGMNRTLDPGESLLLYFDGTNWRPIEGAIDQQSRFVAALTTTTSTSDSVQIQGLTAGAHCSYAATNALASTLSGVYVVANEGEITLNHSPQAGATFNLFCTAN